MRRFATLFWVFSLLTFLFTVAYTHSYLPRYINVGGGDDWQIEKSAYFYIVLAIVTSTNGAMLILGNAFQFLPSFLMPVPKRNEWMSNAIIRKKLYLNLKAWTKGLACIANLFIITALLDIYDINDTDIAMPTAALYKLVGVLLVAWFATYYFWFNTLPDEESLQSM